MTPSPMDAKNAKVKGVMDVLAVIDLLTPEQGKLGRNRALRLRAAVAALIAQRDQLARALREVLKHEKWHASMADEVTEEAKAAIALGDAALAACEPQP
jgi:hypothetical protein